MAITKPIFLDETGKEINESLSAIKDAILNTETVQQGKIELQTETEKLKLEIEDVKATIPEDYTALSENVIQLSNEIDELSDDVSQKISNKKINILDMDLDLQHIHIDTGVVYPNRPCGKNSVSCITPINISKFKYLTTVQDGSITYTIYFYDKNMNYMGKYLSGSKCNNMILVDNAFCMRIQWVCQDSSITLDITELKERHFITGFTYAYISDCYVRNLTEKYNLISDVVFRYGRQYPTDYTKKQLTSTPIYIRGVKSVKISKESDTVFCSFFDSNFNYISESSIEFEYIDIPGNAEFMTVSIRGNSEYNTTDVSSLGITLVNLFDDIIECNNDKENVISAMKLHYGIVGEPGTFKYTNLVLAHLTDMHADSMRYRRYGKYIDNYAEIDFGIITGDIVDSPTDAQFSDMVASTPNKPMYYVVGNHDVQGEEQTGTLNNFYSKMNMNTNTGLPYYYVDFPDNSVRLIVLCQYADNWGSDWNYGETQIEWFINVLKDSQENGYHVIVAIHYSASDPIENDFGFFSRLNSKDRDTTANGGVIEDLINAFVHGGTVNKSYWIRDLTEVNATFEGGGTFICYLCGHRHMDKIGYSNMYDDQLVICTDSGAMKTKYRSARWSDNDLPRVEGTKTQDCFNIIGVDSTNRLINILRIGSDVNDIMIPRRMTSFSY